MKKICIIGSGPGGYVTAIRAAQLGAQVVLIERDKDNVGGTCLNWGCIPTKALVASAGVYADMKNAESYGLTVSNPGIDFGKIMERKDGIVTQLRNGIGYLFKKHNVELIVGNGKLKSPRVVEVETADGVQEVEADHVIIATGSESYVSEEHNFDGTNVITSKEALSLTELPESMIVLGGGVIACEFAMIFAELGVDVHIIVRSRLLRVWDEEVGKRMTTIVKKKKIKLTTGEQLERVEPGHGKATVIMENGKQFEAEKVLVSIGRSLNSVGIGLEEVGIQTGKSGEILVDEYMQTNVPGVYAIGDVTNKIQLAHVASAQGIVVVENILKNEEPVAMQYGAVPDCLFTSPEVAVVGLTEAKAQEQGIETKVGKFPFQASGKALCIGHNDGFVKIVTDAATDKVIGVQIMGPHATDLIAEGTLAVQMGVTAEQLAKTIHAHPTLAECVMEAAEAVHGLSVHS